MPIFSEMSYSSEYSDERGDLTTPRFHRRITEAVIPTVATEEDNISLPTDIIIEILRRLPARYILRFRAVSKLWYVLTQDRHFISEHLKNHPKTNDLGIIALCQSYGPTNYELSLYYFVNGHHKFDLTDLYDCTKDIFQMSNSCDGLMCLFNWYTTCVYVVNPSIKEVLELPPTKYRFRVNLALVQDISTREYKVVRLFCRRDKNTGCEIFDLGSHSWRPAQDPPCSVEYLFLPIVLHGAIHWLTDPYTENEHIIVSFDIKNETFDVITKPEGFKFRDYARLVELDGCLCLATMSYCLSKGYVWVLRDYGKRRWDKYAFTMAEREGDASPLNMFPVAGRDGKMLYLSPFGRCDYFDLRRKRFLAPSYVAELEHYDYRQACGYRESLVSPAAIQEKNLRKD